MKAKRGVFLSIPSRVYRALLGSTTSPRKISPVKNCTGNNDISLSKLALRGNQTVEFPGDKVTGVQMAVSPWQLVIMEFGIAVLPWKQHF